MNSIMEDYYNVFEMYQELREQLMAILTDDDLAFRPFPNTLTLGQLCHEIAQTERSYIDSFKTFQQSWDHESDPLVQPESVAALKEWYQELDRELKAAVSALTNEQINSAIIKRGFDVRPLIQLEIYKEALLIFYGKASIYLRALGKPLPERWPAWIG
jgi:uncharacterized damage-inducible protein DinB